MYDTMLNGWQIAKFVHLLDTYRVSVRLREEEYKKKAEERIATMKF